MHRLLLQAPAAQESLLEAGPQPDWGRLPLKPFEGVSLSPGATGGEAPGAGKEGGPESFPHSACLDGGTIRIILLISKTHPACGMPNSLKDTFPLPLLPCFPLSIPAGAKGFASRSP